MPDGLMRDCYHIVAEKRFYCLINSLIKSSIIGCLLSSTLTWAMPPVIADNPNAFILNQQQQAQFRKMQEDRSRNAAASLLISAPILPPIPAPTSAPVLAPISATIPEPAEASCFTIRQIELQGALAHRFSWALRSAIKTHHHVNAPNSVRVGIQPQCLDAVAINELLKRIQNSIIAKGYITTRVLVAPQNLKAGQLVMTLIPGRVRQIRYLDDPQLQSTQLQPSKPWRSQLWNIYPNDADDLLNLRRVEQALENLKRVPTVDANIQIAPSTELGNDVASVGDSDLLVTWAQNRPIRLQLSLDDSGSKSTGKYQGGVTLSVDNPFHLNDLFYISYNHDLGGADSDRSGTQSYNAFYSMPLGYSLLSLIASQSQYNQHVVGNTQNYIYSGDSQNQEIKLSHVLHRDATAKTTASLGGWSKASHNFIDDTEINVQRRRTAGWSVVLNHQDRFATSSLDVNLNYRQGTGLLGSIAAPGQIFGEATSRLKIITADAQFSVPFSLGNQNLRYSLIPRAQWNLTPLDTQERFSIGSRYAVRGFDGINTLLAERGWTIRNDLGLTLGRSQQELYLGVDGGHVSGASADQLIGQTLIGSALGLRGGYKGLHYDLFIGHPLQKPKGFQTSSLTSGFSLNWSY
jgi:hemolysin activation/secretion protein